MFNMYSVQMQKQSAQIYAPQDVYGLIRHWECLVLII